MPTDALTIAEKRQVIYSSLLRYSAEAIPLRQRVLDRVIRGALLGSTVTAPVTVGGIRKNLTAGGCALDLRDEVVQESLARLQGEGAVEHTEFRRKHAYYLSPAAETEVGGVLYERKQLLDAVVRRVFKDTEQYVAVDIVASVFRSFVFDCFARSGRTLALAAVGRVDGSDVLRTVDAREAFDQAVATCALSQEQRESIESRCFSFLTSKEPLDVQLRFELTQGYYFTELLGVDDAAFSPLSEQAFSGAVFYCDSNVIMTGLFLPEEEEREFAEVLAIARRIGMKLRVTRATLNEIFDAVTSRLPSLEHVVHIVPAGLMRRVRDQVVVAFLRRREEDARVTPREFVSLLDTLDEKITDEWKIEIDERTEDALLHGRSAEREEQVIDEAAVSSRGWGKAPKVRRHDAAHLALVREERLANQKTWFLTRDRSLAHAGEILYPHEPRFCFSQVGLVHSISPFLAGAAEERAFTEVFAALMDDQFKPIGTVFDLSELRVMADFHADVMAMPEEQVLLAFDFVKAHTLHGRQYREADVPRVSLELRKFLSSSHEEQMDAMRSEAARLQQEYEEQRRLREASERERDGARGRSAGLEATIDTLVDQVEESEGERLRVERELLAERKRGNEVRRRTRALGAAAGVLGGLALSKVRPGLTTLTLDAFHLAANYRVFIALVLRVGGAAMFVGPALLFLRHERWPREGRLILAVLLIGAALGRFGFADSSKLGIAADVIGVATFLGMGAMYKWTKEEGNGGNQSENAG